MYGKVVRADPKRLVLAVAIACVAAACSADERSSRSDAGASDAAVDAGYVQLGLCEPTITSLQTVVFEKTCGEEFCHGDQGAFGLRLLVPGVENELVDVPAGSCAGWTRIVPGNLDQSLLYQKITSDHPPCQGHRMPYGLGPLAPPTVRCFRDWIESLAAD
jgi:hypothetical protein